jgi:multisubunit Na+/H+ antiporter MnhF subunit
LVELIDVVLVLAILGFVGTMAIAKYIKKGDIVD